MKQLTYILNKQWHENRTMFVSVCVHLFIILLFFCQNLVNIIKHKPAGNNIIQVNLINTPSPQQPAEPTRIQSFTPPPREPVVQTPPRVNKPKTTTKTTKTTKTKTTKPKWKPRTAADIRASMNKSRPQKSTNTRKLNDLTRKLNNAVATSNTATTNRTTSYSPNKASKYYNIIGSRFNNIWDQPSRREIPTGYPTVTATIYINKDGSVQKRSITKPSSYSQMNISVQKALQKINKVPVPSTYGFNSFPVKVEIIFELT